jgi:hypothetical protein
LTTRTVVVRAGPPVVATLLSPWGKKEGRTRSPKKASNKYIVRRRKTNKKR